MMSTHFMLNSNIGRRCCCMYKAKILIIDDYEDEDINNLFKIFESQDYNVESFTDVVNTLNAFRKSEYNLVLLDLKMEK